MLCFIKVQFPTKSWSVYNIQDYIQREIQSDSAKGKTKKQSMYCYTIYVFDNQYFFWQWVEQSLKQQKVP